MSRLDALMDTLLCDTILGQNKIIVLNEFQMGNLGKMHIETDIHLLFYMCTGKKSVRITLLQ